ncbi:MAG: DUF294 nucleotidyltransferase-like domain-containing protein [Sulfurospirillaceae bacterium]|nr:DUF294 nucleotidyltransferase-like domain-containing protein [Sulfurospirillaceae bacterium]
MSFHDQEAFLKSIHPFECLNTEQLHKAISAINIAYYKKDTQLISPKEPATFLYMIIKGEVGEYQDNELIKVYHHQNCFDADSLIYEKTNSTFKVHEELICFEMKRESFMSLLESNESFKAFFINDLATRIQSAKQKEYTTQLSGFMIARVRDSYIHKPCIVDATCPVIEALKMMEETGSNCIIVHNTITQNFGIVTDSIVRHHIIFGDYDKFSPIEPLALTPIITIEEDDFLFNALLLLTKNSIKRIVVTHKGFIVGILEQIDLLSYFANHTYLVAVQIRKAKTIEELKRASLDFINIIKKLHLKGTKVEYISQLISELNEKIYEKLYAMIVPKELAKKACLIVMGSEGRKEQMLKTDQDNALILANEEDVFVYAPYMQRYTEILIDFGFPRCEGNIMVSNPYWCKPLSAYQKEISRWMDNPQKDDYMHLAIFIDSIAVAGDATLLQTLKEQIFNHENQRDVFMANFAKAALLFPTPISMFMNLIVEKNQIDVKKGGIFPIVQGVRALAMQLQIEKTPTVERIRALKALRVLDENFAEALIEAFDTLLNLRSRERLRMAEMGKEYNNMIQIDVLNQLELDLLKDSFKIVNTFKKFLTHHFKLAFVQ